MKQESFSDMEYRCRKKKTKREKFLEIMDEIIPWDEWVSLIVPHYPSGKRGRPPIEIETMLRMYLLQCWFNLSDEGVEDAIYDSYAMRKFMGINFFEQNVPDATTLLHFRHLLEEKGIDMSTEAASIRPKRCKILRSSVKHGTMIQISVHHRPRQTASFRRAVERSIADTKKSGNPVARYDVQRRQAYLEYPDGTRTYVE